MGTCCLAVVPSPCDLLIALCFTCWLLQKSLLLNPYSLIRDLLGADVAKKLCICLVAALCVVVIVLFSPVIGEGVSLFSAAESLPKPMNYIGMAAVGSVVLCLCCCCCILARRCMRYVKTKCSCLTLICGRCCWCRNTKKRRRTRAASARKAVEMKRR